MGPRYRKTAEVFRGAGKRSRVTSGVVIKSATVWFAMFLLAVANGGFREKVLISAFGNTVGLLLSGLVLSVLVFVLTYQGVAWFGKLKSAHYWLIGTAWLLATLIFELAFGRIVADKTWGELLAAYTFTDGNLWPVVLILIAISPWVCARLRGFV